MRLLTERSELEGRLLGMFDGSDSCQTVDAITMKGVVWTLIIFHNFTYRKNNKIKWLSVPTTKFKNKEIKQLFFVMQPGALR